MNSEEFFTIEEVAAKFKVGKPAVHKWLRSGKLKYVVVGGERRVTSSAIADFIEQSTRDYEEKRATPGLATTANAA